ncbi:phage tail fiber C-terminal domain-containing protein, partial [Escherichia coli]|uniref:phage tail fiber C-terminal domain-containing protein n=1 Tax=Escherichia coli TaxID=562 RepID=UPI00207B6110
ADILESDENGIIPEQDRVITQVVILDADKKQIQCVVRPLQILRADGRWENIGGMKLNRPGFPGECFICELRLPDHRF